jgi:hypothetical protein
VIPQASGLLSLPPSSITGSTVLARPAHTRIYTYLPSTNPALALKISVLTKPAQVPASSAALNAHPP